MVGILNHAINVWLIAIGTILIHRLLSMTPFFAGDQTLRPPPPNSSWARIIIRHNLTKQIFNMAYSKYRIHIDIYKE